MYIRYDERGDLLAVDFRLPVGQVYAREHPGDRFVQHDDEGPLGIEVLGASEGIDLDGRPEAEAIGRALRSLAEVLRHSVHGSRG